REKRLPSPRPVPIVTPEGMQMPDQMVGVIAMAVCRFRLAARSLLASWLAAVALLVPGHLLAAEEQEATEQDRSVEAARAKMYESLAHEVAAQERQGNVLKTVVRLVRPTVVHIEAEKTEARAYGRDRIEEAGSGYIVKLGGRDYVLTNGHVVRSSKKDDIK